MRYSYVIFIIIGCIVGKISFAQQETDPIFFLIKEKKRIDYLDFKLDNKLTLDDSARSALATKVYFGIVDSIWNLLFSINIANTQRDSIVFAIYPLLASVQSLDLKSLDKHNKELSNIRLILLAMKQKNLLRTLKANGDISLSQLPVFLFRPEVEPFLYHMAKKSPIEVILYYGLYYKKNFAKRVVEMAAAHAPDEAKRFMIEGNPINKIIRESTDTTLQILVKATAKYGKKTTATTLTGIIASGAITVEKADSITNNPKAYLTALIAIRMQKNPRAEYSLERALENQSLRFVRQINDLHNEAEAKRFASINSFTAAQLYTLIVYSEEEIFTSSFNGVLKRFLTELKRENGFEFLQKIGFNRFRTFIKQLAAFGKLNDFMKTMSANDAKQLMVMFVSGLDDENIDIGQAVEVADAYTSIQDTSLATFIRVVIKQEYKRAEANKSQNGRIIYGLLSSLIASSNTFEDSWYQKISRQFGIPNITFIKNQSFFAQNNASIWQMYFYDDEDGAASFKSFLNTFNDKNWTIATEDSLYIKLVSATGKPVIIYANKPKAEYTGQAYLEKMLDSAEIQPDVLIHRGHSYYASKTIEKIKPSAKLFVLGSCGGYHNLSGVIQRAPEAQIVSSKQIGVQAVNNPMLKAIAEDLRLGNDILWPDIWQKLDTQLKSNSDTYSRFKDYIPPHKNVSAVFIRTYLKLNGVIQ